MKRGIIKKGGFSLIEIMVSLAIFSIVVLVATGALLSILNANKKTQALKAVVNNFNFALENMARNIRVGTKYYCGPESGIPPQGNFAARDCSGGQYIAFWDGEHKVFTAYRFNNSPNNTSIEKDENIYDVEGFTPLTAPEVEISDLRLYVTGNVTGDNMQPKVRLIVKGKMKDNAKLKLDTTFNIQTTLTQRVLDF
ncbi:MAG TPA: type II secretion system protein [Candidatus Paceibacterota bacterium]